MSAIAISSRGRAAARAREGSALVGALVVGVALFGLVLTTTIRSVIDVKQARQAIDDVRARAVAEAGVQRAMALCREAMARFTFAPLDGVTALFAGNPTITPFEAEPLNVGGAQIGAYTVRMTLGAVTPDNVFVTFESSGYLPDAPADLASGAELDGWNAISVTVRYGVEPSKVFDFAYFINNWGWFYGNTIYASGNAGSYGQFDVAGYAPTVAGQPTYDSVQWTGTEALLSGYRDDNGDGLKDGNDGGVFAGWDVTGASKLKGNGGKAANQHEFEDYVEMPNLSDLSMYRAKALEQAGTISIGGVPVVSGVYGDSPGEKQNVYLVGTPAAPIVLDGPVVIEGDVIISGTVTGQGAIYAGGNVYVPKDLNYLNPPATKLPADNTQAATEAWLTTNWHKDFLGLFAKESVIVGDYTNASWSYYVSGWMSHAMNKSEEDAGEDGIPNTLAGKDGILGTADDDVLEGDGLWTTELYTDADEALGLIPPGYSVGDPIPGTGEDIDGDGVFDGTITMADIAIGDPLNTSYWGGNMPPAGVSSYKTIASIYATNLDATIYTNHTFAWVTFGASQARVNGAVISRNEDIVYGTPSIAFNYDCRLLGGSSGLAGSLLPKTASAPVIVRWATLKDDPNRYGPMP
jgi:hypothetical protein